MGELIGYHGFIDKNGKGFLVNSAGDVCLGQPFWGWLLNNFADTEKYKKIAYDLDCLVSVILRLGNLTEDEGKILIEKGKLHIVPYDLVYYPSKYFSITKGTGWGRPYCGLYDMSQYFENPTLDSSPSVESCIGKAREARDLGAEVSHNLHELGLDGNTLTSPIRSLEKQVLEKMDLPSHLDCPPQVNDLALRNSAGNWVESYQLGGWLSGTCDLDIGAAYSSVLAQLYDTRRGRWVQSHVRLEDALYGFAEGKIEITSPFSPILYSADSGEDIQRRRNFSPTGVWYGVLNAGQIDFIRKYKLGSFEIDGDSWWWIPVGKPPYTDAGYQCLKGVVSWLWEKRKAETPLQKKILKRAMAGLWGRTLSVRGGEYAPSFYPAWGSYVETATNLKVAEFVLGNHLENNLLHIAVDGILIDKEVTVPQSGALGGWRVSHAGGCIIVSSGIAAVEGKEGAEDFALNYDWLKEAIENDPGAREYKMRKVGAYTLAKALNTDFNRLGEVEVITRTITIGEESKRLYPRLPKTGGDLLKHHYKSEPMDVSLIMPKELQEAKK